MSSKIGITIGLVLAAIICGNMVYQFTGYGKPKDHWTLTIINQCGRTVNLWEFSPDERGSNPRFRRVTSISMFRPESSLAECRIRTIRGERHEESSLKIGFSIEDASFPEITLSLQPAQLKSIEGTRSYLLIVYEHKQLQAKYLSVRLP